MKSIPLYSTKPGGCRLTALEVLVPLSVAMGVVGLAAFLWSMRNRQYEDLDGAAERILLDDNDEPG